MSSFTVCRGLFNFRHFSPIHAFFRVPGAAYTSPWLSGPGQGHRHLYTPAALGLDQYQQRREETSAKFANIHESFKDRMRSLLANQNTAMIFTEDFKNVLHLAQDTPEDMALIREMAQRFHKQHEGLRFGMYIFGPVIMRTYHSLQKSQEALEALNDPKLDGFFDQLTSYQVCMDCLFKAGRYKDVLQVFSELQDKRIAGHRFPKACLNLAVASCYKMGTQESLTELQTLLNKMQEYGININRRLLVFGAVLALQTGHPHTALDLILRCSSVTHISVRSVKVIALSQLGRVGDALVTLRAIAEIDVPRPSVGNRWLYIVKEAMAEVEATVVASGNREQQVEFARISKYLDEAGAVSEVSLDDIACRPIDRLEKKPGQERAMLQASFATSNPNHQRHRQRSKSSSGFSYRPPKRQGLMDME